MTRPTDAIGSARAARDLKRGDHVRLGDGRWGLVTDTGVPDRPLQSSSRRTRIVALGLLVNSCSTETLTRGAAERVWSRSPAEQLEYMEVLITNLRVDATVAQIEHDAAREACGGAG